MPHTHAPDNRAIRWWLVSIAALIAIMVLVGGATRLTESGLSIVEWKPVTGALPPLNQAQWTQAFEAYKAIPQYRELNAGMTLGEFKTIFWWEWSHRLLGRVIGVAYLLPFLWFLWRGVLSADLQAAVVADLRSRRAAGRGRLVDGGIGAFGAGRSFALSAGHPSGAGASDFRRHRLDAAAIDGPAAIGASARLKITGVALLVLTFVQIYLGALVAGLRAGQVYNTWPEIDGALIPSAARLFFDEPWWRNLFDNALTVQFEHRMVAYALFVLAMLHALDAVRSRAGRRGQRRVVAGGGGDVAGDAWAF